MKRRIIGIIMSVAMVFASVPLSQSAALADTGGTVTLTIINGVNQLSGKTTVVTNTKYSFTDGATLADVFETAKESGDIADYSFREGYIYSVTPTSKSAVTNSDDYSYYWANYKNGEYASGVTDCSEGDVLSDGDCFQLAYVSYPSNVAPDDWSAITAETSDKVAGSGESSGKVTLKIVKGVDDYAGANVIVSKTYGFASGATLSDLFAAAKEAGDISDYAFSDNYLSSLTPAGSSEVTNAADRSSYWSSYKNGGLASGNDCKDTDTLTDGAEFEFAWEDYPSKIALSSTEWAALSAEATQSESVVGTDDGNDGDNSEGGSTTGGENGDDGNKASDLEYPSPLTSSLEVYELNGDNEDIFQSLYAALCEKAAGSSGKLAIVAGAIGKAEIADSETAVAEALEAAENPTGTNLQLSIIILSALGLDPTAVDDGEGGTVDLVGKLANTKSAIGSWAESIAYTLIAYACVPDYGISKDAVNSPTKLVTTLEDTYLTKDGGYGYDGVTSSPDTTGAVIAGLSCYINTYLASSMIENAVAALKEMQNDDGGFGWAPGEETNVDSTALAVIGLCCAGVDPGSTEWMSEYGETPISALLSFANEEGTGLTLPEGTDVDYAEADVAWALAAYQGLRNTGKSYNVFTMAQKGKAAYGDSEDGDDDDDDESTTEDTSESTTEDPSETTTKNPSGDGGTSTYYYYYYDTVNSGDSSNLFLWIILAVVVGGVTTAAVVIRKKRHE